MSFGDDPLPERNADPHAQMRHDLKTPLTTIRARAQLLARAIRRSSSLTELERGAWLDSLAIIDVAVRAMVPRIDDIVRDAPDSREDGG